MQQTWSLAFEKFGRLKNGQIDIAPLVLIVGDNNSGKSYVMSLLWGLMTEGRTLFPKEVPTGKSYKAVDAFLASVIGKDKDKELTEDETALFIDWYNDLLNNKKLELTQTIFRRKVPISSLRIENYTRKKPVQLKFVETDRLENVRYSKGENYIRFPFKSNEKIQRSERYRMVQYITWTLLMDGLTSPLNSMSSFRSRAAGEALYLPASRTGFMLTYRALVQELMELRIGDNFGSGSDFTLPVFRFLQGLLAIDGNAGADFKGIAKYIEDQILTGEMKMKKDVVPSFFYTPEGQKEEIPMYLTSSLVTELAPLILFLKSKRTYRTLFFEEAEAHLHPRVQRILATAIVKIVNNGMPVFMTTHSDIILQQLNNLMKLASHPNRDALMEKYGYKKEDLLQPADVKAYQFTNENEQTTIKEIEATPYGFPAETFNKVLLDLQTETIAFQEEDDE